MKMVRRSQVTGLVLFVFMLTVIPLSAAAQEGSPGVPGRRVFEIDAFTYRASFKASDGTELFLIRSAYTLRYLYQHHHPTINHHYMRISVGFYFGKTLLGRSIIDSVEFDEIAFYAKWTDSAGYSFDLKGEEDMFSLQGTVEDGRLIAVTKLLDDDARSRYMPLFGGTYVFTNFKLTLIDGSVINYGNIEIELSKHSNEFSARDAELVSDENLTYQSDDKYIEVSSSVQTPLIVFVDAFAAMTLLGATGVTSILILLHIRGRIELPINKLRGILSKNHPQDEEHSAKIRSNSSS